MRNIILILSFLLICIFERSFADTLNVPDEYGTIQSAINSASEGDTVKVADGTHKGAGNRDISFLGKGIVVISENGAEHTIIDAEGSSSEYHRCFVFNSGEDTTSVLQGFTITGGYYGVMLLKREQTPKSSQEYDYCGGGIYIGYSSPKITNNIIEFNSATEGGGIYCTNSQAVICNNEIADNLVSMFERGIEPPPFSWTLRKALLN